MWDKEMRPVLVAGAVTVFVLAIAVAFIASLVGVGGDDLAGARGALRAQKTVAGIGLLPALGLIIAVLAGRRRFAVLALIAIVITYAAWVVLFVVAGHIR